MHPNVSQSITASDTQILRKLTHLEIYWCILPQSDVQLFPKLVIENIVYLIKWNSSKIINQSVRNKTAKYIPILQMKYIFVFFNKP